MKGMNPAQAIILQLMQMVQNNEDVPKIEAVLKRDSIARLHGFSAAEIDTLLDTFAAFARAVRLHYLWRPQLNDAGDELRLAEHIDKIDRLRDVGEPRVGLLAEHLFRRRMHGNDAIAE